jgi:hypothetical protein
LPISNADHRTDQRLSGQGQKRPRDHTVTCGYGQFWCLNGFPFSLLRTQPLLQKISKKYQKQS